MTPAPTREPEAGLGVVEVVLFLKLEQVDSGLVQDLLDVVRVEVRVEAIGRRVLYGREFLRGKGLGEAVIDVEDGDKLRLELVDDPLAF
jgi:hypothetical protein